MSIFIRYSICAINLTLSEDEDMMGQGPVVQNNIEMS